MFSHIEVGGQVKCLRYCDIRGRSRNVVKYAGRKSAMLLMNLIAALILSGVGEPGALTFAEDIPPKGWTVPGTYEFAVVVDRRRWKQTEGLREYQLRRRCMGE